MARTILLIGIAALALATTAQAQLATEVSLAVLGDSTTEGVASADASWRTQVGGYAELIAKQMGSPSVSPLIRTSPLGSVYDTTLRSRLDPFVARDNLSVSGADVGELLRDRADALSPEEIDSETDMVLFPRLGSQMEILESLSPSLIVCWIGANDVLSAATSFDQLDGSQMTPIVDFAADFTELTQRLDALGRPVVFANIPSITGMAYMIDREDLLTFLGSDFGLPEGDYTSLPAAFLIKLGLVDGVALLQDPDFVLDASEVALVQERTDIFNGIIAERAASIGMPVVDIDAWFQAAADNPPTFFGVTLTPRYLGGVFGLDGIHPSTFTHAVLANLFIATINAHFQDDIPAIGLAELTVAFFSDPAIDKDGDGRVRGRFLAGLLETLGPLLGISGDSDDLTPDPVGPRIDPARGEEFKTRFEQLVGGEPRVRPDWTQSDAIAAFKHLFQVGG